MSNEFLVESHLSNKQLNNQSVSLVIPRITRDKIHNSIYYKANLDNSSLRGLNMLQLIEVIVRDLGTLKDKSVNQVCFLGGVEFKCILMKLIEICPTWEQLMTIIQMQDNVIDNFDNKYLVALVLTYIRIQYYYDNDEVNSKKYRELFSKCISDYRKLKSVAMDTDCWSMSQSIEIKIIHLDELVDWLCSEDEIWGIPLGHCQWSDLNASDEDDESSDESLSSSDDESE
ncbi:hypothetical protein Kpol_1053p11 [Vanderwaltozyma polyspora DSM 70294]|uniref:Pre-mRNA-splicing factor 38 n=1 Tax=Vanderwaltozyma polyspora (strain ATCC 22028 / DSM 70294 / BCRC 21397 / CBS 2163 / NBRC 10782 / NRRL Y-8283 / UCD 57-17) TaxID=436907 RepID=A7TN57_VANPO|nr:uncharacterized protein Kpol_1053p11 [Vanderwaltozyma polyspora DSM 70294]EDO16275.1 hypothetical protein Kpol_1053p11 [Vanderwaltozyma polyspora DSM 70294]